MDTHLQFSQLAAHDLLNLGREVLGQNAVGAPNNDAVDNGAHFVELFLAPLLLLV
jgi:hypothetical protein